MHCRSGYRAVIAASLLQAAGHAPGARHIPLSRLPARMKDLPPRRTVVTVCRFALGAKMLAREGREVINLSGGMHVHAAGP
ncbi:MAG: rhodanese-like domain-containing protein [Streptosporangiaceae bacterium]